MYFARPPNKFSNGPSLNDLKREMENKYNMTPSDFDNFTKLSCEALSSGPTWDFVDGLQFAFETLTTIGKWYNVSLVKGS